MSLKQRWERRKEEKRIKRIALDVKNKQRIKQQEAAFRAIPYDIQPIVKGPDAGYYVMINGKIWAQAVIIGKQEKSRVQPGFDEDYNVYAIDELIKIARTKRSGLIWTHIKIPIDPEEEEILLGDAIKKVSMTQEQERDGVISTVNTEKNKLVGIDLKRHTATSYKGRDHYFKFALCGTVIGNSKEKVDSVVHAIEAECKKSGIRFEIPVFNQLGVIKTCLITNYIAPKILQPATGKTVASMSPLRNCDAVFPEVGPIVCINEDTGKPIKINPTKQNPEHTLIFAPTGSGKTVMECTWAGRALANGDRCIIIEPKNEDEDGTDYRNFCMANHGALSKLGQNGITPNPLIVAFDRQIMGDKQWAYQKALNDHYDVVESFFAGWIGDSFNERQAGMLIESLIKIYKDRKIIDKDGIVINIDKWDDPSVIRWPTIHELRQYWKSQTNDKGIIIDPSIRALVANTMKAEPGGPYWWFANSTERLALDNDLIVFDISGLTDNIKNAFSVLIMGHVNTRYFPKPKDGKPRRRTYLFFDELGKLLNTPVMIPYMEKGLREGRAPFITCVMCTQDTNINEQFLNMAKANCKNIFLLCNLDEMNIEPFMKTFNLQDKHRPRLLQKGKGIGLYLKDRYATNVKVVLTDYEKKILLESEGTNEEFEIKPATFSGFAVEEAVREIYEEEDFFIEDWVLGKVQPNYPGYTRYNVQDPFSSGSVNAWINTSKIKNVEGKTIDGKDKQDLVGVEGYKHYSAVCIIDGRSRQLGYRGVEIHHNDREDISMYLYDENGKKVWICIEFEGQDTHNIDDWNEKLKRAQKPDMKAGRTRGFDHIIFTGTGDTCKEMKKSHAAGFVFPQGANLRRELERIRDLYPNREPQILAQSEAVTITTEV